MIQNEMTIANDQRKKEMKAQENNTKNACKTKTKQYNITDSATQHKTFM